MVDTVVAPSCPPMYQIGLCQCHGGAYQGHVLTRDWERLPACGKLRRLVGARCMAQRTYPRVDHVVGTVQARITQYLVACGYATDLAQREASTVTGVFRGRLATWLGSLPPYLQQSRVRAALQPMWAAGLVAVRIDRNPGRVVVMCVEAWKRLNAQCFTECPRYQHTRRVPATDDADYAKCEVRGFREWMMPAGESITFATVPRATRPYGYWVVKQKSRLREGGEPRLLPIISHCRHPCRSALARVGRALALLAERAVAAVQTARPHHTPMWGLHKGTRTWCEQLQRAPATMTLAEFDVTDCFLNTPRELVQLALKYWLQCFRGRQRNGPWFAVSREGKAGDHWGKPCSIHYWQLWTRCSRPMWGVSDPLLAAVGPAGGGSGRVGAGAQFTVRGDDGERNDRAGPGTGPADRGALFCGSRGAGRSASGADRTVAGVTGGHPNGALPGQFFRCPAAGTVVGGFASHGGRPDSPPAHASEI